MSWAAVRQGTRSSHNVSTAPPASPLVCRSESTFADERQAGDGRPARGPGAGMANHERRRAAPSPASAAAKSHAAGGSGTREASRYSPPPRASTSTWTPEGSPRNS